MRGRSTLSYVGLATALTIGAASYMSVSDNAAERFIDTIGETSFAWAGFDYPFDEELSVERRGGTDGEIRINEKLGKFTVYVNASLDRVSRLFGNRMSDVSVDRDGFLAGRFVLPGITVVNTLARDDGGVHMTMLDDGGYDVGIDISLLEYELLRPGTAKVVAGKYACRYAIDNPKSTGCIPGVDIDNDWIDRLPIGADKDKLTADAIMNIFGEYGDITDPCFIEYVAIPNFNEVYRKYGFAEIDGPQQLDAAVKTYVRYLLRSLVSPGIHPSMASMNLTGIWEPGPDLVERVNGMLEALGIADSIAPADGSLHVSEFCLERSVSYDGPIVQIQGYTGKEVGFVDYERIALMGMEEVPASFDVTLGTIVEGSK